MCDNESHGSPFVVRTRSARSLGRDRRNRVASDGLPGGSVLRAAIVAFGIALIVAVYLLVAPPTLPNERDRTGAAAPSASPAPGGARPSGGSTPLPGGSPAPEASPAASPSPSGSPQAARRHTIQAGDTLLAIAEQYDTTVDAIRAANPGLSETALTIGQEITIPPSR
jgi:hypothetical protein